VHIAQGIKIEGIKKPNWKIKKYLPGFVETSCCELEWKERFALITKHHQRLQ